MTGDAAADGGDFSVGGRATGRRSSASSATAAGALRGGFRVRHLNQSKLDEWDIVGFTLYDVLFMCTRGAAASRVKPYKPRPGVRGDGLAVWRANEN